MLGGKPACISKPISSNIWSRLVAAAAGNLSRRAAAEHFGVSVANAVRWVHASSTTGTFKAKPQGSDKHLHRIETLRPVILAVVEA